MKSSGKFRTRLPFPSLPRKNVTRYARVPAIPAFLLIVACTNPSAPPIPDPNPVQAPMQEQAFALAYSSERVAIVRGSALDALTPILSPAGAEVAKYIIYPAPPAWLAFNASTGTISARADQTGNAPAGEVKYMIEAFGTGAHDGQCAMATITIVVDPAAFGAIAYDAPALTATVGTAIAAQTIAAPIGAGHQNVTYSIAPDLITDTGLAFDPFNGTISGTPSKVAATATTYTVTATGNSGTTYAGYTQTTTLSVTVEPAGFTALYAGLFTDASEPSFLGFSIPAAIQTGESKDGTSPDTAYQVTFTTDDSGVNLLPNLAPVAAKGSGAALAAYSITPELQAMTGLTLDATTSTTTNGRIAGNPSRVDAAGTLYTITITGADGTVYAGREVKVYIQIIVTNP